MSTNPSNTPSPTPTVYEDERQIEVTDINNKNHSIDNLTESVNTDDHGDAEA